MTYEVGQSATRSKTFTDEDVRLFAQVSGDENPVHLDDAYAATTMFGKRIVHGMLSASVISALLANDFPGPGTIFLGAELKFKKPVFIGDTVTVTATVTKFRDDRGILTLETTCTNQDGDTVITGESVVMVPKD